ncbi:hypothetical protein FRC14_007220 [Serendipita sp. 396]|nr:hypothetical protein FRC14_007220 [Serendipita sp. 396]
MGLNSMCLALRLKLPAVARSHLAALSASQEPTAQPTLVSNLTFTALLDSLTTAEERILLQDQPSSPAMGATTRPRPRQLTVPPPRELQRPPLMGLVRLCTDSVVDKDIQDRPLVPREPARFRINTTASASHKTGEPGRSRLSFSRVSLSSSLCSRFISICGTSLCLSFRLPSTSLKACIVNWSIDTVDCHDPLFVVGRFSILVCRLVPLIIEIILRPPLHPLSYTLVNFHFDFLVFPPCCPRSRSRVRSLVPFRQRLLYPFAPSTPIIFSLLVSAQVVYESKIRYGVTG